jgi:hypothetical protein
VTVVVEAGLSVGASREAKFMRRTGNHWSQQDTQAGMGSSVAPAVGFEAEAGCARAFLLAETIAKIRPVAATGRTEPKEELVRARGGIHFEHDRGKYAFLQRRRWRTLQRPRPGTFHGWPVQGPDDCIDAHPAI